MAQNHTQNHGHGDSMTESAQWSRFCENEMLVTIMEEKFRSRGANVYSYREGGQTSYFITAIDIGRDFSNFKGLCGGQLPLKPSSQFPRVRVQN